MKPLGNRFGRPRVMASGQEIAGLGRLKTKHASRRLDRAEDVRASRTANAACRSDYFDPMAVDLRDIPCAADAETLQVRFVNDNGSILLQANAEIGREVRDGSERRIFKPRADDHAQLNGSIGAHPMGTLLQIDFSRLHFRLHEGRAR